VAQEGCDEENFILSEGYRFEFGKLGMGRETLGCQLYLQDKSCHDMLTAGVTPDFVAFICLEIQVGVEQD